PAGCRPRRSAEFTTELRVIAKTALERDASAAYLSQQDLCVRLPQSRIPRCRPGDQGVQIRRYQACGRANRGWGDVAMDVRVRDLDRGVASMRLPPGQQFKEHHASAVDV